MSQDFQQPPKPSGGMGVLTIVLIVLGVLLLLCAGTCGLFGFGLFRAGSAIQGEISRIVELQQPTSAAESAIKTNEEVIAKLGDELNFGPPGRPAGDTGELNRADARFTLQIMGNVSNGTANVQAAQIDGIWKVLDIEVKCDDGTVIKVPPPTGELAPEMNFDTPDLSTPDAPDASAPESGN